MYDTITIFYIVTQINVVQKIPRFPGNCPIFTDVIAKKNIKETDQFTTCELRKFLERDHDEAEIFPLKNYQNLRILRGNI